MADLVLWSVLAVIVIFYGVLIYLIRKKQFLADRGVTTWGPMIFWRTERGQVFIDRVARYKRFWNGYAFASKLVCLAVGVFIMALLIWEATVVSRIPADKAPTPEMMLGIPGINPVIPVVYGIIALVVAIVVHELAHGILTRVGNMRLKSLGAIFLIIPLGAFAEPEEQELVKADRKRRTNVYAVGAATNVFLAIICVLLFCTVFAASAEPVRENPVVVAIGENSPALHAKLGFGAQIISINGMPINNVSAWEETSFEPGSNITITYFYSGQEVSVFAISGLTLVDVSKGMPAYNAGFEVGMIIASLNDTTIHNQDDLDSVLALTQPYQTCNVTMLRFDPITSAYDEFPVYQITLASRKDYLLQVDPGAVNETFKDRGMLGVNTAYLGTVVNQPSYIVQRLAHPFYGVKDFGGFVGASLLFIALPFQGLAPIDSPLADLFVPTGALAWMPVGVFWFIANCLYWLFWINLMVGMTNVLPAIPLDGGYLFKDALSGIVARVKKNSTEKERQVWEGRVISIMYMITMLVFFLIIWQLIGPRLL
jgi:membrane-associated protease RseP (regulator of RpoE activity)